MESQPAGVAPREQIFQGWIPVHLQSRLNQMALFKSRKQSLGIWPVNPPVMCDPDSANVRSTCESVRAKAPSKSER